MQQQQQQQQIFMEGERERGGERERERDRNLSWIPALHIAPTLPATTVACVYST